MQVNEIFTSIDGEVNRYGQGVISTFIRFTGCNLRCYYCDTRYAHYAGDEMTVQEIFDKVEAIGCKKITLTGGEPLIQAEIIDLVKKFREAKYNITIETNGSVDIDRVLFDGGTYFVADYKLDYEDQMRVLRPKYLHFLQSKDFIKIVIGNEEEYKRALEVKNQIRKQNKNVQIAFSSIQGDKKGIYPLDLLSWLIRDKEFDVILNVQIHKYIGIS